MSAEMIRDVLGWCGVMNIVVLLTWWAMFSLAHDWLYQHHSKWFKLSPERFDTIQYAMMGSYKLGFILLNIVPYLALRIVG